MCLGLGQQRYTQSPFNVDPGPGGEKGMQINDCGTVEYSVINTVIEVYTSQNRNSEGGCD